MVRSSKIGTVVRDMNITLERAVESLFQELNTSMRDTTPVRTGYARNNWRRVRRYRLGDSGAMIENPVSYIGILDKGSSRQAPQGIYAPSLKPLLRRRTKL